ncbi:MAG: response regulator transcription factor [Tissierellia bacterium]|nr:response regulator transcription factor [Tissierellia bacterium]
MRLLLAEDEKDLRDAIKAILEKHNFSVDAVANGKEALDYLKYNQDYDCLILDLMMPIMDGYTVIKELRDKKVDIPILVLSAKSLVHDRVLGLDLGADDYLVKPFDSQELLARIRALTRRPITGASSIIKLANLSLDRSDYSIKTPSGQLVLPTKEFQILELLMSQPKAILPSDSLFNRVWGLDSDADQNSLWVTLSNLRKKLVSLESEVAIKSVRNVGYTLEISND